MAKYLFGESSDKPTTKPPYIPELLKSTMPRPSDYASQPVPIQNSAFQAVMPKILHPYVGKPIENFHQHEKIFVQNQPTSTVTPLQSFVPKSVENRRKPTFRLEPTPEVRRVQDPIIQQLETVLFPQKRQEPENFEANRPLSDNLNHKQSSAKIDAKLNDQPNRKFSRSRKISKSMQFPSIDKPELNENLSKSTSTSDLSKPFENQAHFAIQTDQMENPFRTSMPGLELAKLDAYPEPTQQTFKLGPEFLFWNAQKPEPINIPFQNDLFESSPVSSDSKRNVLIHLNNGQKLIVACTLKSTIQDIFDAIVAHLNLIEHSFFGLTYALEEEYFFLEFPEQLSDVAPDMWRHGMSSTFTLYFQVKFYSSDINHLKDPLTRHYFYLQLRKDLLDDKYDCSEDLALILGSLALQAEYGDVTQDLTKYGNSYFKCEHYVAESVIAYLGLEHVQATLSALHNANSGLSAVEAEGRMIMQCCKIGDYGRHFYRLLGTDDSGRNFPVHLGISTVGIDYWQLDDDDELFREQTYSLSWSDVKSVSLMKRSFIVETYNEEFPSWEYIVESNRKGKYLLQLCSSHYKFQDAIARYSENENSSERNIEQLTDQNGSDMLNQNLSVFADQPQGSKETEKLIKFVEIKLEPGEKIGFIVGKYARIAQIKETFANSQNCSLLPGDKIIAIDGQNVEIYQEDHLNRYLQNVQGNVNLIISREKDTRGFESLNPRSSWTPSRPESSRSDRSPAQSDFGNFDRQKLSIPGSQLDSYAESELSVGDESLSKFGRRPASAESQRSPAGMGYLDSSQLNNVQRSGLVSPNMSMTARPQQATPTKQKQLVIQDPIALTFEKTSKTAIYKLIIGFPICCKLLINHEHAHPDYNQS